MRCVVTAGPTYEELDQVRRLTNFSTGRLGSELAVFLAQQGHDVVLLRGHYATWREHSASCPARTFTTTADLRRRLRELGGTGVNAIFHAAAVSDFGFGKIWSRAPDGQLTEMKSGKLTTRGGALLAELVPLNATFRGIEKNDKNAVKVSGVFRGKLGSFGKNALQAFSALPGGRRRREQWNACLPAGCPVLFARR
jgi:phosphopantothenoylcysteine synthetase/decarboxylase